MAEGQSATTEPSIISKITAHLDSGVGSLAAEQASREPQKEEPQKETAPEPEAKEPEIKEPEINTQVEGVDVEEEIPLDRLEAIALEITVKGEDGKDVVEKPTVKELRDGYMRQKDYSRKTAEVARQREEVPEKIRQGIESERAAYQQNLQNLQAALIETVAPELKDVNWSQLAVTDPFEYVRLDNRAKEIQKVLGNIQSKQQELTSKQKADESQARQKSALEARTSLVEKIPGWNDGLYQTLMDAAAKDYGYKREEVLTWIDPKAFHVLHDAYQYRQLKAEKPIKENKVVVVPKVIKPGPAKPANTAQARESEAMKRLEKSGRYQDAAAIIRSRLG